MALKNGFVLVLKHEPSNNGPDGPGPVFHISTKCPMTAGYPQAYLQVPRYIVEAANFRQCARLGPCRQS